MDGKIPPAGFTGTQHVSLKMLLAFFASDMLPLFDYLIETLQVIAFHAERCNWNSCCIGLPCFWGFADVVGHDANLKIVLCEAL